MMIPDPHEDAEIVQVELDTLEEVDDTEKSDVPLKCEFEGCNDRPVWHLLEMAYLAGNPSA